MSIKVVYDKYQLKKIEDVGKKSEDFDGTYETEALNSFARDISWGTFTDKLLGIDLTLSGWESAKSYEPEIINKHSAVDRKGFSLNFRDENFNLESEGVDHFIGTIAGDVLTYSYFDSIQVADFEFNGSSYNSFFKGPNVGTERIYNEFLSETLGGQERPIVAFTIKPRMGLTIDQYKKICQEVSKGHIDIIEDDERLIDPLYCPFKERVDVVSELQKKCKSKFSVNITGPLEKMKERLIYAHSKGLKFVKVDVLVTGFDSLKAISDYIRNSLNNEVAITCYPDAITKYRDLSRRFVLKMSRLCGADIIYTSTPQWSRMDDDFSSQKLESNMSKLEQKLDNHKVLADELLGVKRSLPTITNGCDLSHAEIIQFVYRKEYNHFKYGFYIGGGISSFPVKLKKATKEWMDCIKYTSSKSLDDYENYNYNYEQEMYDSGIIVLKIKKEMGK